MKDATMHRGPGRHREGVLTMSRQFLRVRTRDATPEVRKRKARCQCAPGNGEGRERRLDVWQLPCPNPSI